MVEVEQHERFLLASSACFSLRLMTHYSALCERDLTATTVFLSVAVAGTQHLRNRPVEASDFEGRFYRDLHRRSISVASIARSLELPTETVRRKCIRLVELGLMKRTPSGVIVTSDILAREDVDHAVKDSVAAMRVLLDQFRRSGVP